MIKGLDLLNERRPLGPILAGQDECRICHYAGFWAISKRVGHPCPVCQQPRGVDKAFYGNTIRTLTNVIQHCYHRHLEQQLPDHYKQTNESIVTLVVFCTLGEVLLERFLWNLMGALNIPPRVLERLLDDHQFPKDRAYKLFPSLTGEKWQDAVKFVSSDSGVDFEKVLKFYFKTREPRNLFLHKGNRFVLTSSMPKEILQNTAPLLDLFVRLHNRYIHEKIYLQKLHKPGKAKS
jgi:hypothetical protein